MTGAPAAAAAATAAGAVTVPTYRGEVPGGSLGTVLMHEHVFVRAPELDAEFPHPEWDADRAVQAAARGMDELWELGVRTLVDLTVPGLGRDVGLVAQAAARTRLQVVAATGWYTDALLPLALREHAPGRLVDGSDPLVDMFLRDVTRGIAGTGVRAGVLKVMSGPPGFTLDVTRVWDAAAHVHRTTGVPVVTHSDPAVRNGLDQVRVLRDREVDLTRTVIGHSGDSTDLDYLLALLDTGVILGMDRFGMTHTGDDGTRTAVLAELVRRGFAEQLVLSQDCAFYSRVTPPSWRRTHAPSWSHAYLLRVVLPRLERAGIDPDDVETMMVRAPRRILAGERGDEP
jgi:phosphotriesterase-related protein